MFLRVSVMSPSLLGIAEAKEVICESLHFRRGFYFQQFWDFNLCKWNSGCERHKD